MLDALRHKRNLADYTGASVDSSSLATCVKEADKLLAEVAQWLRKNHPDLVK